MCVRVCVLVCVCVCVCVREREREREREEREEKNKLIIKVITQKLSRCRLKTKLPNLLQGFFFTIMSFSFFFFP